MKLPLLEYPLNLFQRPFLLPSLLPSLYKLKKYIPKMATVIPLTLTLPSLPSSYSAPSSSSLTPPSTLPTYPAGPSYLSSARRQLLQRSFAEDDAAVLAHLEALRAQQASDQGETLYPGLGEEEEDKALLANDPKEWKKQDHYAVLGLGGLRYKATDDHIKVALTSFLLFVD